MNSSKFGPSSVPRWYATYRNGDLELWIRIGAFSFWIDTAQNRWELNGHSLFGWVGRRDPVDTLKGLPFGLSLDSLPADRTGQQLKHFLLARTKNPILAGPAGWAALVVGLWLCIAIGSSGSLWLPMLTGAVWILLGAGLRGVAGLAYGFTCLLLLGTGDLPAVLLVLGSLLLLMAQGLRWRRAIAPMLGASVAILLIKPFGPTLSAAQRLQILVWLVTALGAGFFSARPRNLRLGLDADSGWRYHSQIESLKGLDNSTLWSLEPGDESGLPPEPAAWTRSRWQIDGRTRVAAIGSESFHWIFLPESILVVQEGVEARLHRWPELSLEGRPCIWEARPPGLPEEAWILNLRLGQDRLALLFGEAPAGRTFQSLLQPWAPASAPEHLPEPAPSSDSTEQALSLLGLQPGATWAQIRTAYRRNVRRCHPDQYPRASPAEHEALERKLKALNAAMECLEGNRGVT